MDSTIAKSLKLRYPPVAILFTNERPRSAAQFKEHRWGCVISMLRVAAMGYTAVFDRDTTGCLGGQVGLCFGDAYKGRDMGKVLATGREAGDGLGFVKTPDLAQAFVESLPVTDIPQTFVVLKPLAKVDAEGETPALVIFLANPDQLSALTVLANYDRPGGDAVTMPFASGCQAICLLPFAESKRDRPRAVVGGTDLSARPHLDPDLLTFTVPWPMYEAMEANVAGSFLEREVWGKIWDRIPG